MRREFLKICLLAGLAFARPGGWTSPLRAAEDEGAKPISAPPSLKVDKAAQELGRKVLAIQRALQNPKAPGAIKAVTELGHDSRYYVMVRGWLTQELAGAQSIRDANRGQVPRELTERIAFLHQAIRAIDLE